MKVNMQWRNECSGLNRGMKMHNLTNNFGIGG
jgi:hypothetical protein